MRIGRLQVFRTIHPAHRYLHQGEHGLGEGEQELAEAEVIDGEHLSLAGSDDGGGAYATGEEAVLPDHVAPMAACDRVLLSRWVHERFPGSYEVCVRGGCPGLANTFTGLV